MTVEEQLVQVRELAASPPACVSEVKLVLGYEGETMAYFMGTWRAESGRRRYVCAVAWPDGPDECPNDVGKLVFYRSDQGHMPSMIDPGEVAARVEANADWLTGGDE